MQQKLNPLHTFLDDWKQGKEPGTSAYVIEVIWAYDDLLRERTKVIP